MTTKEEFVKAAEDLCEVMADAEPFYPGQVVTGAYPGRANVFGVISEIVCDDDGFDLKVQWEDGDTTRESCFEVIQLSGYAELTGRHYDAEAIRDKVKIAQQFPSTRHREPWEKIIDAYLAETYGQED